MRTIINPVLSFLSGTESENTSQTTASLEILRKGSQHTFNEICRNLENIEKEEKEENEVAENLQKNQDLSRNLTNLTNLTRTEIFKTLRETREFEKSLDNVRRLNNLSTIAAKIENLLQNHFEVEQERSKETVVLGRGHFQISIKIPRGQLAEMMRVFVENEAEAYEETLSR